MRELVLILTDFFPPEPDGAGAGAPRLPALETILARSRSADLAPDWRRWLASRAAAPWRALTPAAAVAAAWELSPRCAQPGAQVWLATPVHYFAGLDSVHLHPEGVLRLDAAQQQTLVADFERVFAGSPWQLHTRASRELLLSGPAIEASGADPALFAGIDPSAGLPRGEGAATLRRLGSEIEMWLYEHPLNSERRARGELPVTTLWFWGSGPIPALSAAAAEASAAQPRLYGSDTYAEALWRVQGSGAEPLPAALEAALPTSRSGSVILYPMSQPDGLTAALLQLELRWLPAALRALRTRRVSVLRLLIGTRAYTLRRLNLARFWRRRPPWWESLA